MTWLRSLFARPDAVSQITAASITREHAAVADALRAEGAAAERARIIAVYQAASWVTLEPLVARLMFDGRTPPEAAALAKIAAAQAGVLILAEAVRQRDETPVVMQ